MNECKGGGVIRDREPPKAKEPERVEERKREEVKRREEHGREGREESRRERGEKERTERDRDRVRIIFGRSVSQICYLTVILHLGLLAPTYFAAGPPLPPTNVHHAPNN